MKTNPKMTSIAKKETYNYIPTVATRIVVCMFCGKTKTVPCNYIEYTYNKKVFCSWDCKSKYKRAHPDEELTHSEKVVKKLKEKEKC